MKKNYIYILVAITALTFTGCKKYLDVNVDPNNPADVTVDFILPAAQTSLAVTMGNSYFNLGGHWAQYYTQSPTASQYKRIEEYNVTTDIFDGEWSEAYAGALNDFEIIRTKAIANDDYKYYFVATLMQSYGIQMMADLYDKVPFSEAFKGATDNITSPKFDEGSDIYPMLLERIDSAVSIYNRLDGSLNATEKAFVNKDINQKDLVYGGDMDQWLRFANTLKLKLHMRMSYTGSANSAAITALVSENNFITSDATITQFSADDKGKRNPFFEVQMATGSILAGVNQRASSTTVDILSDMNDPRIGAIYTTVGGAYVGNLQGDFNTLDVKGTDLSKLNITATTPVYFLTVMEKDFFVAEAELRFNSDETAAQAAYEAGIENSFAIHGMGGASTLYGAGGAAAFKDTTDEGNLYQIGVQKWIGLANVNNLESFFEINRTHYPVLTPSVTSILPAGETPKRLFIPDVEISRNTSGVTQVSNIYTKVWWDKK